MASRQELGGEESDGTIDYADENEDSDSIPGDEAGIEGPTISGNQFCMTVLLKPPTYPTIAICDYSTCGLTVNILMDMLNIACLLSGQMDAHMSALQMDPAPEPKAASIKPSKVWTGGGNFAAVGGQEAAEEASDTDVQAFDEKDMATSTSVSKAHIPACFFDREAYCTLSKQGLADLPDSGSFYLSYHNQSLQWHGRWPAESKNYAPTWGEIRSELKSLLLVLIRIWQWHLSICPEDVEATSHLKKLESYADTVTFWSLGWSVALT